MFLKTEAHVSQELIVTFQTLVPLRLQPPAFVTVTVAVYVPVPWFGVQLKDQDVPVLVIVASSSTVPPCFVITR